MGVAEIDVVCREAGDCFVEGDGDGDQSVIAVRDGVVGVVWWGVVGGGLGVGGGCVGGCPALAVGADRRQRAQRAFAGVVLDVVEIEAGDAFSEGEGDGGAF